MDELNQGEEYEEYVEDEDIDFGEESNEDIESGIDTIYGIPKDKFILIAAGVFVVLVLIIIIAVRVKSKGDEEYIPEDEEQEYVSSDDGYIEFEDTTVSTDVYDANGNMLGTADSTNIGDYVFDTNYNLIAQFSDSGNEVFDVNGLSIGYITIQEGFELEENATETVSETQLNIEELRKLGYTGDEIELAINNNTSMEELVTEAEKLHDIAAKEALTRMSDTASPEFQTIVNNSIFCMPNSPFIPLDKDAEGYTNLSDSYVVNADYTKVSEYGLQLYIKCKIANGTYVFMCVTPERYQLLPESGNIVLSVTYTLYGTSQGVNMYVTNIEEVDITKLTVNPQDSAVDLNTIVQDNMDVVE